jgi:hypothetical protein
MHQYPAGFNFPEDVPHSLGQKQVGLQDCSPGLAFQDITNAYCAGKYVGLTAAPMNRKNTCGSLTGNENETFPLG